MDLQSILAELTNSLEPKIGFVRRAELCISQNGQRLGVFSGSFNPPTIAHVRLCEHAQKHLHLQEVLLLLTIINVDKTGFDFSLEERVGMMEEVAREYPSWSAAVCSHGRFAEKAQAVTKSYPEGTKVWFIVGYDTLVRIFDPRFYPDMPMQESLERLFELACLGVFPRGNSDEHTINEFLKRSTVKPFADRIEILPTDPSLLWISSTIVRQKLNLGEPVKELVPQGVLKFLKAKIATVKGVSPP